MSALPRKSDLAPDTELGRLWAIFRHREARRLIRRDVYPPSIAGSFFQSAKGNFPIGCTMRMLAWETVLSMLRLRLLSPCRCLTS
jgi:hypothetical protein